MAQIRKLVSILPSINTQSHPVNVGTHRYGMIVSCVGNENFQIKSLFDNS